MTITKDLTIVNHQIIKIQNLIIMAYHSHKIILS
jgi:hypothetical protein